MDKMANLIISLKNGGKAGKATVIVPHTNLSGEVAKVLFNSGYIASYAKKSRAKGDVLELGVSYVESKPRITDVKRVSKSSRRVYCGVHDIKPIKNGRGLLVLSTPKGILTGDEARKAHVGGEALFQIW
ncbi:MAG: ribosomal protein small subunit ribosomal protein [Patescibacteria group bacterium]|nr:ribosomal protein small subunit ribosomal protein [Patescibacteria group bacterium]